MRTGKLIRVRGKTIILECPKHFIPYRMESSKDPLNEGAWRYYYCEECRRERMKAKTDGRAVEKPDKGLQEG